MYSYFGSCREAEYGSSEYCEGLGKVKAECCIFEISTNENMRSQFCVTEEQRGGSDVYGGKYRDRDYTLWNWRCKEPEPEVEPVPEEQPPGIFDTYNDSEMQYFLWITYLSGAIYLWGFWVVLFAGLYSYGYM